MQRKLLILLSVLTPLFWASGAMAQTTQPDAGFVQQAATQAVQSYTDSIGHHSQLYTGPEYFFLNKSHIEGHQFFITKNMQAGAVRYDGAWYQQVPLLYDLVLDEVMTTHPTSGYALMLVKQKVDAFTLGGETFVHLGVDSTSAIPARPGFYSVLYSGETQVLARREKELQERTSTNGMEGEYREVSKYFLFQNGTYHQVGNKRTVLRVLHDEKKQLNKYIRENKLKFRKQREEAILQVARHYDSLQTKQ